MTEDLKILLHYENCNYSQIGYKKLLQDLLLKQLKIFDKICKKHNIEYFFTHGTLLGIIRYQKMIPWDIDINIGMLRAEYNKFKQVFNIYSNIISLKFDEKHILEYGVSYLYHQDIAIYQKIQIMPFDIIYKKFSVGEQTDFAKNIYQITKQILNKEIDYNYKVNDYESFKDSIDIKNTTIIQNINYPYSAKPVVYFYDDIFPLKNCIFHNHKYKALINNYNKYIYTMYGINTEYINYQAYNYKNDNLQLTIDLLIKDRLDKKIEEYLLNDDEII